MERVPRQKHGLAREALSPAAAKVCTVLREAGYSAYVVGGAVRDLLLGIVPKDFDVATDARPEQVKPLFRRALIIGRRFRLVHVMMGADTVEVSTFRGADPDTAQKDEHGRVLRRDYLEEGIKIAAEVPINLAGRFAAFVEPAAKARAD